MTRRMLLIPVEGDVSEVEAPGWEAMAAAIGATYIERVRVDDDWSLAVDESGLYKAGIQVNERASLLYGTPGHGQPIVGDALLGREGFAGDGIDWLDTPRAEAVSYLVQRGATGRQGVDL